MIRIVLTAFAVFASSIVLAAAAIPKAVANPSRIASPTLAGSGLTTPAGQSGKRPLHGYYLAEFTNEVGSGFPVSSFCLRFMSSGAWSSSEDFSGTYLVSGKELFASAVWLASPAAYISLQGSFSAKQGAGVYTISGFNGYISGGGTFTMMREHKSGCT